MIAGTEFIAANHGVGARIWQSYQVLDIESLCAGLATTALMRWALPLLVGMVKRAAMPWRKRLQ